MEYNKGQFYLTWIIFGMGCYFSSKQFILLLFELFLIGGMTINIKPDFLIFSKLLVYGILALTLIFISIRIIHQNATEKHLPNYRQLRKYYLIILGVGIISSVSMDLFLNYRFDLFDEYSQSHGIEYRDMYKALIINPIMFWTFLFLYFGVLFFILTKKSEKLQTQPNS